MNKTVIAGPKARILALCLLVAGLCAAAPASAAQPKTFKNSIGMEFVDIPAGSYMRGCDDANFYEKCMEDEKPRRRINISAFRLGKYEVTNAQWEAVMGEKRSRPDRRNHPVERVNWYDAREFILALNRKEGHNRYRLPTEAEWEYAARAGSTTMYYFGDDYKQLGDYAWYKGNSGCPKLEFYQRCTPERGGTTHPVGKKKPNAWGLYDMLGNVWEWVQDAYDRNYYARSPSDNPQGPSDGRGLARGGAWDDDGYGCRVAYRYCDFAGGRDLRDRTIGFRVAMSVE